MQNNDLSPSHAGSEAKLEQQEEQQQLPVEIPRTEANGYDKAVNATDSLSDVSHADDASAQDVSTSSSLPIIAAVASATLSDHTRSPREAAPAHSSGLRCSPSSQEKLKLNLSANKTKVMPDTHTLSQGHVRHSVTSVYKHGSDTPRQDKNKKRLAGTGPELTPVSMPLSASAKQATPSPPKFSREVHKEVQESLEALCKELAILDEFGIRLERHAATDQLRRVMGDLLERRQVAVAYCKELHRRCALAGFHFYCPSESTIMAFQRHVEEDLAALQDEMNLEQGHTCDPLVFFWRKLLAQRWFWRVVLNAVE